MGIMPVNKLLLTMSIPMMISMLVQAMYNVVDSIFVAQVSENALTAVSLAFPMQNLLISVGVGTGVGVNALLSKSLGETNFYMANKAANVLTLIKHDLGEEEMKVVTDADGVIKEISKTCSPSAAAGERLGIEKIGASYSIALYKELEQMMNNEHLENKFYELAFERLIPQGHSYKVVDVTEFFSCELDTVEDFENAKEKIPADLY